MQYTAVPRDNAPALVTAAKPRPRASSSPPAGKPCATHDAATRRRLLRPSLVCSTPPRHATAPRAPSPPRAALDAGRHEPHQPSELHRQGSRAIRAALLLQHYLLAQCSFNKLLYRPHSNTAMLRLWNQDLTHRQDLPSQDAIQIANNISDLGQIYNREDMESDNPARDQVLGEDGVRVHSMVLPGLTSSTSINFSGPGEIYTIRHDVKNIQCLMQCQD